MTGKFFESMNNKKYYFNNFKLIIYFYLIDTYIFIILIGICYGMRCDINLFV